MQKFDIKFLDVSLLTSERWIILGDITNSTKTLNIISKYEKSKGMHFKLMQVYNETIENIWIYAQKGIHWFGLSGARFANTMGDGFLVLGSYEKGTPLTKEQIPRILIYAKFVKEMSDFFLKELVKIFEKIASTPNKPFILRNEIKANQNPLIMRILIDHGNVYESYLFNRYTGDRINYCSKILNKAYKEYASKDAAKTIFLTHNPDLWEYWIKGIFGKPKPNLKLGDFETFYPNRRVYKIHIDKIEGKAAAIQEKINEYWKSK